MRMKPLNAVESPGAWAHRAQERVRLAAAGDAEGAAELDRMAAAERTKGFTFPWIYGTPEGDAYPSVGVLETEAGPAHFYVKARGQVKLYWEGGVLHGVRYTEMTAFQKGSERVSRPGEYWREPPPEVAAWLRAQVDAWKDRLATPLAARHARVVRQQQKLEKIQRQLGDARIRVEELEGSERWAAQQLQTFLETYQSPKRK